MKTDTHSKSSKLAESLEFENFLNGESVFIPFPEAGYGKRLVACTTRFDVNMSRGRPKTLPPPLVSEMTVG